MLQHLCNMFNSCAQRCSQLPRHTNVVSKVLCGKTLPYQPQVSEAEEKTQWLKTKVNASNNVVIPNLQTRPDHWS